MNIDSSEKILTTPILEVRKLLRRTRDYPWNIEYAESILKISLDDTDALLKELLRHNFIESIKDFGEWKWQNTMKGNALAMASAAKPVTRRTADRNFTSFMERVDTVNTDPYYLYKVTKVILFGSYLTNVPKVNDIDLAIELSPKEMDAHLQSALYNERISEVMENGKRFRDMIEECGWPIVEVRKFLKSGSRIISLHNTSDDVLKATECKVIYSE